MGRSRRAQDVTQAGNRGGIADFPPCRPLARDPAELQLRSQQECFLSGTTLQ